MYGYYEKSKLSGWREGSQREAGVGVPGVMVKAVLGEEDFKDLFPDDPDNLTMMENVVVCQTFLAQAKGTGETIYSKGVEFLNIHFLEWYIPPQKVSDVS